MDRMNAWWRRRKHNLTWKRVARDVTRALSLMLFLLNNDHHSDENLDKWREELIGILFRLDQDLDNL